MSIALEDVDEVETEIAPRARRHHVDRRNPSSWLGLWDKQNTITSHEILDRPPAPPPPIAL